MKKRIEELEMALQNLQANILSVKYELESDRGQELALLLRKIRILRSASAANERAAREDSAEYDRQNDGISREYDDSINSVVDWGN
ncbi:hypothetical protein Gotur_028534 [Gossypium turneri]